jgi:hypothetical protein
VEEENGKIEGATEVWFLMNAYCFCNTVKLKKFLSEAP